jgi:hypothetical protein
MKIGNLYLQTDDGNLYIVEDINLEREMIKICFLEDGEILHLHTEILIGMINSGEDKLVSGV